MLALGLPAAQAAQIPLWRTQVTEALTGLGWSEKDAARGIDDALADLDLMLEFQPLFDGFLLESQLKLAKGQQLQYLQAYRKAVLSAFACLSAWLGRRRATTSASLAKSWWTFLWRIS